MRLLGALLLIWIAFGVSAFAQQAPVVGLRVGTHPTYGRVVMDWPAPVSYRAPRLHIIEFYNVGPLSV